MKIYCCAQYLFLPVALSQVHAYKTVAYTWRKNIHIHLLHSSFDNNNNCG